MSSQFLRVKLATAADELGRIAIGGEAVTVA
jgi:hypothetical protein